MHSLLGHDVDAGEQLQRAPNRAAADQPPPGSGALQDTDVVPWAQILHCARSRVGSMALLHEFMVSLAFACVYLLALTLQIDAFSSFQVSGAMRGLLVDAQARTSSGEMKGFFDICSYRDWYEWADTVLVEEYYGSTERDYTGRPVTGRMRHMLNWQNHILGGITVVQQRSAGVPCRSSAAGIALPHACTRDTDRSPDTQAYGSCDAALFTSCTADRKFGASNFSAALQSSFVVQLGPDEGAAKAQLLALQDGNWIDARTRRIQVFVHVWNLNTDVLQSHEMAVLFRAGGVTRAFFTERHAQSEYYNFADPQHRLRAVLEAVSLAFLVHFWIVEIAEIYYSWRGRFFLTHFKSGWNIADLLHCAIFSSAAITWAMFVARFPREHFAQLFDDDDDVVSTHALAILDFFPLYDLYVQLSGAAIVFHLLKMLKTFRFHIKTSAVVNTVSNIAAPMFSFLASLSVVFFSFVYVAHIDFGLFFMDWHTLSFAAGSAANAFFETLPLSDVDKLPTFANYYFYWQFVYVIVMNFIAMNLVVAIIIEGHQLSVERKAVTRFASQRMLDQFIVAVLSILCMPVAAIQTVTSRFGNGIHKRVHGLHQRLSCIFGHRFQVHYSAPHYFLDLSERLNFSDHKDVAFGLIMAEVEKKCNNHGVADWSREAVSMALSHFMQGIKIQTKNACKAQMHHKALEPLKKNSTGVRVRAADLGKSNIQLRDEVVLMLRSHAKSLQRHSDSLHAVSFAFPVCFCLC
jgi:hypothetical protein